MVLKTISVFLLAMGLSFTAMSSPALKEQEQWCKRVTADAVTGARANQVLKMDKDEFQQRLVAYANALFIHVVNQEITPEQAIELIEAVEIGWYSTQTPEETAILVYNLCMGKKTI
jgi:hypothetical protein